MSSGGHIAASLILCVHSLWNKTQWLVVLLVTFGFVNLTEGVVYICQSLGRRCGFCASVHIEKIWLVSLSPKDGGVAPVLVSDRHRMDLSISVKESWVPFPGSPFEGGIASVSVLKMEVWHLCLSSTEGGVTSLCLSQTEGGIA